MRTFQEHLSRPVQSLDGFWDFTFLGEVDPDKIIIPQIDFDDRMPVPQCFDAMPAYAGKRGLAAYRQEIYISRNGRQRLAFDGVSHWCRVFINENLLGEHVGGFVPFAFDFEAAVPGWIQVIVLVDNRINYERNPLHLEYFDWYHYGGIARSVCLHHLGQQWVEDLRITTTSLTLPTIQVEITLQTDQAVSETCTVFVDEEEVMSQEIDLDDSVQVQFEVTLEDAELWTPEHPHLHHLRVVFGDDDLIERFGIRTIATRGKDILLNDTPLRLLGFNRHEIHPDFGHTFPDGMLMTDVQLLKEMGCNFVRGSHYPQDPRFLDLCDEFGLLVWSESIGWQHTAEHLNDPHFIEAQKTNINEMIETAYNHPSVFVWGIINESHSHDPECRAGYITMLDEIRSLDSHRPVTYASCHPFEDLNFDLVDIISINRYPGWYGGELEDIPGELDQLSEHLATAGFADKPLIISEIGAGAIPGFHDRQHQRWTEEYQRDLYDMVIKHLFEERDRVCGLALWLFADFRSSEFLPRPLQRPRGFNNKGCVDEYRRPKLSFDLVKQKFLPLIIEKNLGD
jgi:beta-glucuronidase